MGMNLITQEQLSNLKPQTQINGVILVKNYSIQLTKNGKEYVVGDLQSGVDVPFKAWSSSIAFTKLKAEDYQNMPSYITGTVDNYGGNISIVLDSVQAVEGFTVDQFFPVKYNIEAYWEGLIGQIHKRVSDKGIEICNKILFENKELADRFKVEFAAMTYHDNCKGGLLAHTYKVILNVANIMIQYPDLVNKGDSRDAVDDYMDLIYIGALLHDVGKTVEMNYGVYQPTSFVTHKYFGVEFIAPYKDDIINAYSEDWYYQLISIMLQHHGQYGEPCRTVASYIVNRADELDAQMTSLQEKIESLKDSSSNTVKIDGTYLTW